jgi:opacity protein-like surface antigen
MQLKKIILLIILLSAGKVKAQDTTDLMSMLESEVIGDSKNKTNYTTATFKTTRLINGHTVENVGKGVLDFKLSHRFGKLNNGSYELFGLDNATMRMGFDYGINRYLMIGIGRSTFEKTYDAFFKIKLLRQSTGKRNMPITLSYVPTIALKTLKFEDPDRKNYYTSRLYFTHQLIIGRKFSEGTSIQLMPTYVHRNLVKYAAESNELFAVGIGGRQKLTKRISVNAEYYYQIPGYKLTGTTNSLSLGFDIETGGHVFQLHFTNSRGMNERTFVSETTGEWGKGDIYFGFNISRVFTIGKRKK